MWKWIKKIYRQYMVGAKANDFPLFKDIKKEDIQCPVCGYYCLGKGGHGCIDKPGFQD